MRRGYRPRREPGNGPSANVPVPVPLGESPFGVPMPTAEEYEARIKKLRWPGLQKLWESITRRDTPGWGAGKAFEYLILRAFELDGARVRWPYPVNLFGE